MTPYYSESGITIYHGDCREVLPTLAQVEHVITDPPYEAEAHTLQRRTKPAGWREVVTGVTIVEPLHFEPMTATDRDCSASAFAFVARRWVLVFCQIEGAPLWRASGERAGLVYRRTCLWVKPDGMPQLTGDRPGMGYEAFVALHRNGKSRWNAGGKHGVYTIPKGIEGAKGKNEHPTYKPEPLMVELVADFTDPGETVLDPFMGSGTTLVAAKRLGRKAIGIELEEKYCEVAARRLQQGALALFEEPA